MENAYDIGDEVRAVKALRNDGTFPEPGIAVGAVLVPEGTVGWILNVGLYLQDHIVYAVRFGNGRVVGCLERELAAHGETLGRAHAETLGRADAVVTGRDGGKAA